MSTSRAKRKRAAFPRETGPELVHARSNRTARGRSYSLISSTVFFTEVNDFWNIAFSSAVSSI